MVRIRQFVFQYVVNLAYLVFLLVGAPWMVWRIVRGKNRRGWNQRLWGAVATRPGNPECLWVHAVSVGEVNLLAPVLERLKQLQPELDVVISTTTETGFDHACRQYPEHYVFFCPFDFSWAIRNVLRRLQPVAIVLAELELWPNLISVANQQAVPVIVINGRLSESSFRGYRRFGIWVRPLARKLAMVLAQNRCYADRFIAIGCDPDRVRVTGSVKFDSAQTNPENPLTDQLVSWSGLADDHFVFVAGSTQLEEDLLIAEMLKGAIGGNSRLKVILVPRHPSRCEALGRRLQSAGLRPVFRSSDEGRNWACPDSPGAVLVVDRIGELGAWWGRANVGYVGGSMGPREGQNMIEPAALAVPVAFGPRTRNFRDVVQQLIDREAAVVVRDAADLAGFVRDCMERPDNAVAMGDRARQVVCENVGAANRTVEALLDFLPRGGV